MRTRTIFEAYTKACIDTLNAKEWRQRDTFERELLRRMDERDALRLAPIKFGDISITMRMGENGEPILHFDGADDATLAPIVAAFSVAMNALIDEAEGK